MAGLHLPALGPHLIHSMSDIWGQISLSVGSFPYIGRCSSIAAFLGPTHEIPVASFPSPQHDKQKFLTLPRIPRGESCPRLRTIGLTSTFSNVSFSAPSQRAYPDHPSLL